MKYQRPVVPPRTDLRSRRKRVAARVMVRVLDVYERLKSRLLIEVRSPADDPFYRVPENLEAFRPGEVIDSRPVEVRGIRRLINADAWQVKFRSTDASGAEVSGFTTVMIPRRPFNGSVRPLLSYQCAIDSLGAAADPSYTLRHGDQQELPFMVLALRRGWAVVTTDFTGPQHAFGALPLAARLVLDGIRAAIAFEPAGFGDATPIGLWGYSGGGQATLFAAEQQPAYAPELNIVGAAAGAVGVDPVSSPEMFEDANLLSGIPFGAVIGASRGFPDVDLLGVLTPQGQAMVAAAADMTIEQLVAGFPFLRWSDYLTVPSVLEIPGMRTALEAVRLGQATPTTTIYLYHAVHDQYPAIADVDKLVEKYRRESVDVTYRRFRFGEHMIVALTGVPSSLRFLSERFG
jgi:acetyl esterase/lipase